MPDKITFYAIVDDKTTADRPAGLLRRLEFGDDGFTDEGLRRDFSWDFTPLIMEWERSNFSYELVEVSHAQAGEIIEYFRKKWGPFGQPLDS
jgi:hypothetical protein